MNDVMFLPRFKDRWVDQVARIAKVSGVLRRKNNRGADVGVDHIRQVQATVGLVAVGRCGKARQGKARQGKANIILYTKRFKQTSKQQRASSCVFSLIFGSNANICTSIS